MAVTINPPARTRARRKAGDRTYVVGRSTAQDGDDILQSVQRGDFSQSIPDPFSTYNLYDVGGASDFRIQPPPVNLAALLRMPNDNSILRQCIEAMVINIEGHGWRLEYVGPDGEEQTEAAQIEKANIESLLGSIHPEHSLVELRKRLRWDIEGLGFSYIEVGRTKDKLPVFMGHIPAHTMRITTREKEAVQVVTEVNQFGRKANAVTRRHFRRFVQIVGTKKVYFKEFGDPRDINPTNGKVEQNLKYEDTATEIIMVRQYYPGQDYGLPRWFNNLVAIQGSRQAELTNLDFFKENAIPAMAVLVSGGTLATGTIEQIESHVTAARGRAAQNRVLIIEVEGDETAASKDGTIPAPKVDLKPLAGERIKEGQFLEYDKAQQEKVRSSFRLSALFTGHSQDFTRSTAQVAYEVAESQVFGPERAVLDDIINRHILGPYGVKYWEVRSNPPRISNPEGVVSAVRAFDEVGAMTPNVAIGLANEQFGLDIPTIIEPWGNYPWAVVRALATAGKIKGFEEIMAAIEETEEFEEDPEGDEEPEGAEEVEEETAQRKRRAIRRVMGDLATLLQTNKQASYRDREVSPPPRTRPRISPLDEGSHLTADFNPAREQVVAVQ
jgi:PBSX family phage portal protein